MAITQTGTVLQFGAGSGLNANTGTASSTITVPVDAEFVVVSASAYTGTEFCVDGALTFTKGGVDTAMTAGIAGSADDTSKWGGGAWYLVLPDTGTNKSLKWDWPGTGTSTDGSLNFAVRFWKGIDTASPVRSSAGVGGTSFPMNTGTLTAQSGDKIDVSLSGFVVSQDGTGAVNTWNNATSLAEPVPNGYSELSLASGNPTGNTTVGAQTVTGYSEAGIIAIVIKPAAGGAAAPPGKLELVQRQALVRAAYW